MTHTVLDSTERARSVAQAALDARNSAQDRNQRGQFATPSRLALDMAQLASEQLAARCPVRFMDPGVGTGIFFYAACKVFGNRIETAWGYETDAEVGETARQLWGPLGFDVRLENFCTASPPGEDTRKANLIICNPPYVRHHHLSAEQKRCLHVAVGKAGYGISGLAGLYCYFLILAHRWLSRDGVAVWLVPAEFLDVNYGKA